MRGERARESITARGVAGRRGRLRRGAGGCGGGGRLWLRLEAAAAAHTGDAHGEEASAEAAPKAKALPMGGKSSLSARGTTDGNEKGSICGGRGGGWGGGW